MKKFATRLLYVFSFSLLFTALYLNFFPKNDTDLAAQKAAEKPVLSSVSLTENGTVANPENNTALK
jgi:hypothetical protein